MKFLKYRPIERNEIIDFYKEEVMISNNNIIKVFEEVLNVMSTKETEPYFEANANSIFKSVMIKIVLSKIHSAELKHKYRIKLKTIKPFIEIVNNKIVNIRFWTNSHDEYIHKLVETYNVLINKVLSDRLHQKISLCDNINIESDFNTSVLISFDKIKNITF